MDLLRPLAFYHGRATHCRMSNDRFAQTATDAMIALLPEDETWRIHISGSTPPYDSGSTPDYEDPNTIPSGHIEVTLLSGGKEYDFGVRFGVADEKGQTRREPFNKKRWLANPGCSWDSGVVAINFDEAWRIVVLFALKLRVTSIEVSYGLGM